MCYIWTYPTVQTMATAMYQTRHAVAAARVIGEGSWSAFEMMEGSAASRGLICYGRINTAGGRGGMAKTAGSGGAAGGWRAKKLLAVSAPRKSAESTCSQHRAAAVSEHFAVII